jgi:hypothetical protein
MKWKEISIPPITSKIDHLVIELWNLIFIYFFKSNNQFNYIYTYKIIQNV